MADFTTKLFTMVEHNFDLQLNEYPIFDEKYRPQLNKKIISHYYYREIGFEVEELFRHFLKTTMNEIMPYYNQLYLSELLKINPLHNVDLTTTYNKQIETDTTTHQNTDSSTDADNTSNTDQEAKTQDYLRAIHSDTPQGLLNASNVWTNGDIWASDLSMNNNEGTGTTNSDTSGEAHTSGNQIVEGVAELNSIEDYIRNVAGSDGRKYPAQLLIEYRSTFLNIDTMVIRDLADLFMGIYK